MGTKSFNNYADLITFSRASGGTALRPVSYGPELVTNGTFDTDSDWSKGTGWTISGGTAVGAATYSYLSQTILTIGKLYSVTYTVGYTSGIIALDSNTSATATNRTSSGTYTEHFIAVGTVFTLRGTNFTGTLDNVSVKEVLFDQPDGTLTLFNHPDNIPRIEYDADGNRLGLLIEEQRTNYVVYSNLWASGLWAVLGIQKSSNQTTSPSGENDAGKLQATATNNQHNIQILFAASNGNPATVSFFLKYANNQYVAVAIYDTQWNLGVFDLQNGTTGAADSGVSSQIQDMGDGWYRCSITFTVSATTCYAGVFLRPSNTVAGTIWSATGNEEVYLYGASAEQASFPTSYIPTSGSTATRAADVASIPVSDFGYNQSEGTLFVEAKRFGTSSEFPRIAQLTDGTSSERISVSIYGAGNTAYANVIDGGVNQASLNETTSTGADTYAKLGFSFANNDFAFAVDGVVEGTDTSGTVPDNISEMLIGDRVSADQQLNGHIKSIKYFPRRLTNDQLQELTQ